MIASTASKFVTGVLALGAGVLVLTHPRGFASFANGVSRIIGGTTRQVITAGR